MRTCALVHACTQAACGAVQTNDLLHSHGTESLPFSVITAQFTKAYAAAVHDVSCCIAWATARA
jgi:hypothetical protein